MKTYQVSKGPSCKEQNNIDWHINYAEAVKEYKQNLTIKKVLIEICLMNGRAQFLLKKRIEKLKCKYGNKVK